MIKMLDTQILCRKDQMQVSNFDKDMVSNIVPLVYREYFNHPLGLTLSTPGLVTTEFKQRHVFIDLFVNPPGTFDSG